MEQDLKINQRVFISINGAITEAYIKEIIWNGDEYTYRCFAPCHLPWISRIWSKRNKRDWDKDFVEPRWRIFKNLEELNNYMVTFKSFK